MSIWFRYNTSFPGSSSCRSQRWITLILDFLDFRGDLLWWIGLQRNRLPFGRRLVLFDYRLEEFVEVMNKGGFEELWGELDKLAQVLEKYRKHATYNICSIVFLELCYRCVDERLLLSSLHGE